MALQSRNGSVGFRAPIAVKLPDGPYFFDLVEVEVICSYAAAHRRRVEERVTDLPGFVQPTWAEVVDRDYQPRDDDRLVIDTALTSPDAALATLRAKLASP